MITELLPRVAARFPSWTALKCGDRNVSYGELHAAVSRLARALAHRGIRPGDRIGFVGEPSIELATMAHAAVAAGAIPCSVHASSPVAELQALVDHVGFAGPVAEAAVVGQRVDDTGERVIAFAALCPESELALDELQRFCADRLAAFKIPSSLVVLPALPRTDVGKIDKVQLRRMCPPC